MALKDYTSIRTGYLFYFALSDVEAENLYVTTLPYDYTYDGITYQASPVPLGFTQTTDALKANDSMTSVALSGVDTSLKQQFLAYSNNGVSGRVAKIYRVMLDIPTETTILVRPAYIGVIDVMTIDDVFSTDANSKEPVAFTFTLALRSQQSVLKARNAGRYTSQNAMKRWFTNDDSFNAIQEEITKDIILGKQ